METPTPEPLIHVLHWGKSACNLPGVPRDWPKGDTWVVISEWRRATCTVCKAASASALGEADEPAPAPAA